MIGASVLIWRIRPEYSLFFPLAPAVIGSLYINWDLWAVVPSLLAIYFLARNRNHVSALFLGVAIATKFFPIVLLLGIALYFWHRKEFKSVLSYILVTALTWLAINVPIAIHNFDGWWRFFKLNIERENDLGSLWYSLSLLKFPISNINFLTIFLAVASLAAIVNFSKKIQEIGRAHV